ncbi:unnamed protein product [Sphagnum troendelagicum]|uniref:Uncharacterized protein n=1 Tax=Sphagnum troendelagicum TaxID=128251 RepID=A0ABP0UDJ7_9BRYO
MLLLRQPRWAQQEGLLPSCSTAPAPAAEDSSSSSSSSSSPNTTRPPQSSSPVLDLVLALTDQRLHREVALSLRQGLRDARSEFCYMRVRGLNALAKFLASSAKSQKIIELFQDSQSYQELQVVPVLFEHTLVPHKWAVKNPDLSATDACTEVESPPSTSELTLALRVLEGCCLLDTASQTIASQYSAVSELINLFLAGASQVQKACLDCLLALMLDSSTNQKEFERVHGLRKIADMLRNGHLDGTIRLQIAEFIVVLLGHVLPSSTKPIGGLSQLEPRKSSWMVKWAHLELVEILGEESAAVVDTIINEVPAIRPDADSQQSSLSALSRELLRLAT